VRFILCSAKGVRPTPWLPFESATVVHFVNTIFNCELFLSMLIPVAARSKTWVCGRLVAGIAGSNPAEGMDVCCVVLCR
jgi:hypothetical protein